MAAQFTVGQVLPSGATVTADAFVTLADGTTVETMTSQNPSGSLNHETITVAGPGTPTANQATIQTRVNANLATIEAWITANPSGAVLTAGQTLSLAKMLAGLCRLTLGEINTLGGS